jgi:glutamate-1-semialdehyde 2,1-aminomutase
MNVKQTSNSDKLFDQAKSLMPGGVSSPVRAFNGVSGDPRFISHGKGSKMFDVDDNEYIDYVGSFGPLLLGHSYPAIVDALHRAASLGTSFGAPTKLEVQLAEVIKKAVPVIDKIRFVNSGTEATMSALRLARAFAKRDKIIKFEGCYHGHADMLLVQAGSGVATLGLPDSPGVPKAATEHTLTAPFNDLDSINSLFEKFPDEIAAIIIEPVAGNMGVVSPNEGYLSGLREITRKHGALLIFDEVMTGFRVAWGGAQELYGVTPDLVCLGKVIGGGLPVGAYGGRSDIMSMIAPEGPVYQAGTLSGNPLAMSAGLAMLNELQNRDYERLESASAQLESGLLKAASEAKIDISINRVGSMMTLFFSKNSIANYEQAKTCDLERFAQFFHAMLEQGVYLPPSQFEAWFVSFAHSEEDISHTIESASKAFQALA